MDALSSEGNFLGITDPDLYSLESSEFVIQQLPYEYSSSYHRGSSGGPAAIIEASKYVEFYDEELQIEGFRHGGIATLPALNFDGIINKEAVDLIYENTTKLLDDDKFVISLGAEHTITYGTVKAFAQKFKNISVLQLDAHSDLRESYQNNIWSHASVMARVNSLPVNIVQVGVRAQCKEEVDVIKNSPNISTIYAHQIRNNPGWQNVALDALTDNVYITIDADGFDPSVIPHVGTPEPNGLYWNETVRFLHDVILRKNVVGFDIVEMNPVQDSTISEYALAKLTYKLINQIVSKKMSFL
jgi:N1-aminopropylagmatine ureohydrolase